MRISAVFSEFDGAFQLLPTILQMVLVNVMVVFEPKGSVLLLTWEIMGVHNPEESFQSLFERRNKPKISAKLSQEDAENVTRKCYVAWAYEELA